jgi:hypothetical protein
MMSTLQRRLSRVVTEIWREPAFVLSDAHVVAAVEGSVTARFDATGISGHYEPSGCDIH